MTFTLMKCNLTMALNWCVRDFSDMLGTFPENENSALCISKAIQCKATCVECLEAFDSSKLSVRGLLMQAVVHSCDSFLKECELLPGLEMWRCFDACRRCKEECENLIADQDFFDFLSSNAIGSTIGR